MIVGIGVDIAETIRFEKLYARFGDRVARRLLTDHEINEFANRNRPASFLATRFAAKEAAAKALGTGFGEEVGYKSIEVGNDHNGKPLLRFFKQATVLAEQKQVGNVLVSISDEKHYVVAMVVLET
ncbi:MAG: holo-ACP synthase [Gammaproteobacteria bacterium]